MMKWYALCFQDQRLDQPVRGISSARASELNAAFAQQGVENLRWKEVDLNADEFAKIADEWMVANFGEDGLHLP